MAHSLKVDLGWLKGVADVYLQDLANEWNGLNHQIAGTADNDGGAFAVYPAAERNLVQSSNPSTAYDWVYEEWSLLRDKLCDYLAHTSTNYQLAVTAMDHIRATYASADHVSATAINEVYEHDFRKPTVAPDTRPVIIR